MRNRSFWANVFAATLFIFTLGMSNAFAIDVKEGQNYKLIVPEQPKFKGEAEIEVVEVFWYGCPHCHRFQPFIEKWLEEYGDKVTYTRMSAALRPSWNIHARAYFAAEAIGAADKTHQAFFNAIHVQKKRLNSEEEIVAFYKSQGVDENKYRKAFKSFAVESKLRRANELAKRYGVFATPTVVINGKYRTDGTMVPNGFQGMIEVIDHIVKKEMDSKG